MLSLKKGLGAKITHGSIEKKIINALINLDKVTEKRLYKLLKCRNIAAGYVPYFEGQTEVFYYNFFSINYGIRTNIDLILSLVDSDFNPILVSHRKNIKLDLDKILKKKDNKTISFVVIFILNPKIPFNHAGAGGHLRFFGIWNNFASFCHSWPLPGTYEIVRGWLNLPYRRLAERRFFPLSAERIQHSAPFQKLKELNQRGDLSPVMIEPIGFTVLKDKNKLIRTLFHNRGYERDNKFSEKYKEFNHVVSLPPLKDLDIEIFFGECCTTGSEFNVNHYYSNKKSEKVLLNSSIYRVENSKSSMLSSIINSSFNQENGSWVEFIPKSGLHSSYYLNLFYYLGEEKNLCDASHSHTFNNMRKIKRKTRTLKFAPFRLKSLKNDLLEKQESYLALWADKSQDISIRVRLFCLQSSNFEMIFPVHLKKSTVTHLNLNNYIKSYYKEHKDFFGSDYIVQIESEDTNVNANLYHFNIENSPPSFAVDHFTGG